MGILKDSESRRSYLKAKCFFFFSFFYFCLQLVEILQLTIIEKSTQMLSELRRFFSCRRCYIHFTLFQRFGEMLYFNVCWYLSVPIEGLMWLRVARSPHLLPIHSCLFAHVFCYKEAENSMEYLIMHRKPDPI